MISTRESSMKSAVSNRKKRENVDQQKRHLHQYFEKEKISANECVGVLQIAQNASFSPAKKKSVDWIRSKGVI